MKIDMNKREKVIIWLVAIGMIVLFGLPSIEKT